MIQFKVSAPGKVILFGEHAVVYGKTAVAGSLDLRTSLDFAELPEVEQTVNICFPHVNLIMIVPLQQIHNFLLANRDTQFLENYEVFYCKVKEFVSMFNCGNLQQKLSLEAFFYLLFYITLKEGINVRPFRIQLTTELALGAGLGSSASFAVCLAACFLHWSHLQKDISKMFDLSNLENISKYALNCERTMHGSPSGIDNAVCTYGSIIEFKKGEYMKPMNNIQPMKILLIDTRVSRSTKAILEKLLELKNRYPVIIDIIMDAIDNISNEAIKNIQKLKNTSRVNDGSFSEEYKQLMVTTIYNHLMFLFMRNYY